MESALKDAIFDRPMPSGRGAEPKQTRRQPQIHANYSEGAPIAVFSDSKRFVASGTCGWLLTTLPFVNSPFRELAPGRAAAIF